MDFRERIKQDRLTVFSQPQPSDISEEQWLLAKKHAETSGQKLSKDLEQSCFYYYVMGDSFADIANKLDLPLGLLVYTGLSYEWPKKRAALDNTKPGSKIKKAETAAADLVTDAIVATAAVYKHRLAEVIKNPEKAAGCPLIPRNIKEMQILLQLLEVAQPKESKGGGAPSVNVNIANMGGGQPPQITTTSAAEGGEILELNPGDEDRPDPQRLEVLRLLQRVKMV
jgi:hypothetical protein